MIYTNLHTLSLHDALAIGGGRTKWPQPLTAPRHRAAHRDADREDRQRGEKGRRDRYADRRGFAQRPAEREKRDDDKGPVIPIGHGLALSFFAGLTVRWATDPAAAPQRKISSRSIAPIP